MRLKKINDWQLPKPRNCNGIFSDPLKKYKLRHSSSRKYKIRPALQILQNESFPPRKPLKTKTAKL
jgi:hypothetical protein